MGEPQTDAGPHDEVLSRIGHMTRALHENLRGLGLDKLIEKAASDIPDARDRLDYVARLSMPPGRCRTASTARRRSCRARGRRCCAARTATGARWPNAPSPASTRRAGPPA
jgi:hypothetical protein